MTITRVTHDSREQVLPIEHRTELKQGEGWAVAGNPTPPRDNRSELGLLLRTARQMWHTALSGGGWEGGSTRGHRRDACFEKQCIGFTLCVQLSIITSCVVICRLPSVYSYVSFTLCVYLCVVYLLFIYSLPPYCAELWVICRHRLQLLERFHQRCLRSILNIHWSDFVTSIDVLEQG